MRRPKACHNFGTSVFEMDVMRVALVVMAD
jgi:hypothetical protein